MGRGTMGRGTRHRAAIGRRAGRTAALRRVVPLAALAVAVPPPPVAPAQEATSGGDARAGYEKASAGTRRLVGRNGLVLKLLVEPATLGGSEVAVGEITFPPGTGRRGSGHAHGAIEIFYVLSGVLEHVVDGEAHTLRPGMAGVVRPGDTVVHRVPGSEPVRALVIWVPGDEAERVAGFLEEVPLEEPGPRAGPEGDRASGREVDPADRP